MDSDASPETEKLQKVLARAGIGSRREMERWIQMGRVSVNGQVAQLGDRVRPEDDVYVQGKKVETQSNASMQRRMLMYYKPEGEVCTRTDPQGRPTVFEQLPELAQGRWVAVGRLDVNSQGLLLLTTDGELANRLMHPSFNVEREYAVRVKGEVNDTVLNQLLEGVPLDGSLAKFHSIEKGGGEGANQWYRVILKEGRRREVRRLWETQGVQVSRLIRVRYGNVSLPTDMKRGEWRELDNAAIEEVAALVSAPMKRRVGLYGRTKLQPSHGDRQHQHQKPRRGYLRRRR